MKNKIKDESRKEVVDEYVKMVKSSIERIKIKHPEMTDKLKRYIEGLEQNIKDSPYKLGYLKK